MVKLEKFVRRKMPLECILDQAKYDQVALKSAMTEQYDFGKVQ